MYIVKIFLKLLLKRLFSLIPNNFLSKFIKIFKTGDMNEYAYSRHVFFDRHFKKMQKYLYIKNPVIMELGPGNALTSSIFAKVVNAKKIYLVDSFKLANKNVGLYKNIIKKLPNKERKKFSSVNFNNLNAFLESMNAEYYFNCLEDLKKINDNSIDYLFSHSVMEHVRLKDLKLLISEMYRILRKGGLSSHVIDFSDHLGFGLNNLRYSKRFWEFDFVANSGFYTNRVSSFEMINLFENKGFKIIKKKLIKWKKSPIRKKDIHKDFSHFTNKDIKYHNLEILLSK